MRLRRACVIGVLACLIAACTPGIAGGDLLFEENFDNDPFAAGRWTVYYGDCIEPRPGTVKHYTGLQDACGSTWGYVYREYRGTRCVPYTGPAFSTAGYTNLTLRFWTKNDSGSSIAVAVKQDGVWTGQLIGAGASSGWTETEIDLDGVVTGIRFFFIADSSDVTRRLDCISITGDPDCTPPVEITAQPQNLAVCTGETASFSVEATGSNLTYQWQKDGVNLQNGGDISGALSPNLQIANAEPADNGQYRCVVTGDCGTVTSSEASLYANDAPTILQQPEPQDVCEGQTAVFTVEAIGAGAVSYQWQKNGVDLQNGGDISGALSDTLQIANVDVSDEGNYRCVLQDDCGSVNSNQAALTLLEFCGIETSPSGHYVSYGGETLLLVGESGTQCVPQNTNIDHREWLDDCHARGIRAVHVWSFLPPRQKQDGSQIEDRYGYLYPGVTPWARHTSGPLAYDQLYQWNLQAFDDGANGDLTKYWPRMRDLVEYARDRGILVGITVFTGWTKHDYSFDFHPLNVANGGHLANKEDAVIIASPGTEVWQQAWSNAWSNAKKTQWVWERLSIEFIDQLNGYGNVFFVFFDEHSYSEGNMGDHFLNFFQSRDAVWVDWSARRASVDWVMSATLSSTDKNSNAVSGFWGSPVRPYLNLEGPPYMGDDVRTSIWSFAIGGGHFFFHADEGQETTRTGIMGYDPYVPGGDKGMIKRDWLGIASRLFNQHVDDLDAMVPHNELSDSGTYCLADPGSEYVVYSKINASTNFNVNLGAAAGKILTCRFYNPRNGNFQSEFTVSGGGVTPFTKPNSNDWALHLLACDGCYINDACYDDGQVNPANPCQVCNPSQSPTTWSDNDGAVCDDGLFCNGEDTCQSGACSQHPGDPCDAQCQSCNEGSDTCENVAGSCDDGVFCNGEDTCQSGACSQHPGDPCDAQCQSCNEGSDICENVAGSCDDGVFCNGTDTCSSGSCSQHAGDPCDAQCQSCNETQDRCDDVPGACDDGIYCNGTDTCSDGGCTEHAGNPCDAQCQSCNESADQCDNLTGSCDDTLFCNGDDTCSGGSCSQHAGNPCDAQCQSCNEGTDACDNVAGSCDDGTYCNGPDECQGGSCSNVGPAIDCDDGVPCSIDSCDEEINDCDYDLLACTAVVAPECPATPPASLFPLAISITEVEGEDAIGFSVLFDEGILSYEGYSIIGTALEDWTVSCERDLIEPDKIVCTGNSAIPLAAATDVTFVNLNFDWVDSEKGEMQEDGSAPFVVNPEPQKGTWPASWAGLPASMLEETNPQELPFREQQSTPSFETMELIEDLRYFTGDACSIDLPDDDDDDTADDDDDDDTGDDDEEDDDDGIDDDEDIFGRSGDDDDDGGCGC